MSTCIHCQLSYPDELESCPEDGTPLIIEQRYAIRSVLREDDVAIAYTGYFALLDQPVLVKVRRREGSRDPAAVQQFLKQAMSDSKFLDSNVLGVRDFGVLRDGRAYVVSEFIEGQMLSQVRAGKTLAPLRACMIAAQVATGLHAAHQRGLVHLDLTPENIFLATIGGHKDFVKVAGLGSTRVGTCRQLAKAGIGVNSPGTPQYMSPEQATGQQSDHRVDQYALGCILYELLTGVPPFLAETPEQTLSQHVHAPVMPPRTRNPELTISRDLESAVLRSLAKRPEQRFPSLWELRHALRSSQ